MKTTKIGPEEIAKMYKAQGGLCGVCTEYKPLKVDYALYGIRKARGLLCYECKRLLNAFRDNVVLMEEAAAYLEKHGY